MHEINQATIIASLAIPAVLSIGVSRITLKDFVTACNEYFYSPKTNKKPWFGLGEFLRGILFDLYTRY